MTTTEGTDPVFNNERTGERLTTLRMLELISTASLAAFFVAGPLPGALPFVIASGIANASVGSMSAALDPFIIRSTVLQAGTMTGVNNITVTSIPAWVKSIGIEVDNFDSGEAGGNLFVVQLSTDNGSSWFDDEYSTMFLFTDNVATTFAFSTDGFISSTESVAGDLSLTLAQIVGIQEGAYTYGHCVSYNFANDESISASGGLGSTTDKIDALRLLSDTGGTFDGGVYTIVGYA